MDDKLTLKWKEFRRALIQYRINKGFTSGPFEPAREYKFSNDTIYKYETGVSFPSPSKLATLIEKYGLDKKNAEYMWELFYEIREIRKELKGKL